MPKTHKIRTDPYLSKNRGRKKDPRLIGDCHLTLSVPPGALQGANHGTILSATGRPLSQLLNSLTDLI